jgi:hypothetical protein
MQRALHVPGGRKGKGKEESTAATEGYSFSLEKQ